MKKKIFVALCFISIAGFYFYRVGEIPAGLFTDEALIGWRAYQLVNGNISGFYSAFFYYHFNYLLGNLSVFATAPTIFWLGLSELSVRISSVFFSLVSLIVVYKLLRLLKAPFAILSVFTLAFTPVYYHISRINFGHLPSFFLLVSGYYLYARARVKKNVFSALLGGLAVGFSSYGYGSFMLGSGLVVVLIAITELFINRLSLRKYKYPILFVTAYLLTVVPIIYTSIAEPAFLNRIADKSRGKINFVKTKDIRDLIVNYPKYYSRDYLFNLGEIDLPGAFITRHSVGGNGILLPVMGLWILVMFYGFVFRRREIKNNRLYVPLLLLILLYPLPDLLTTSSKEPPYSFAIFYASISIPIISSYAFATLKSFKTHLSKKSGLFGVMVFIIIGGVLTAYQTMDFFVHYQRYPLYSADFWGWQYGPKEIMKHFLSNRDRYDEMYMTGYFNAPHIFLKFYDPEGKCKEKCFIGGIKKLNLNKKQLFAFRKEEIEKISRQFNIIEVIYYPNSSPAFYLVEFY